MATPELHDLTNPDELRSTCDRCSCSADALAHVVQAVAGAPDIRQARKRLVELAREQLGTPWLTITRPFEEGELGFVAVSGPVARQAARAEQRLRQGPGWQVETERAAVVCEDLLRERRWPEYCRALSSSTSIRSVLAIPLATGGEGSGALVAYSSTPAFFGGARLHEAIRLAEGAAVALASVAYRTRAANLEVALHSNREIATAVGIVMDRLRVTDQLAFGFLREVSQRRHLKLSEIAARIVVSGELPVLPSGD